MAGYRTSLGVDLGSIFELGPMICLTTKSKGMVKPTVVCDPDFFTKNCCIIHWVWYVMCIKIVY